VKAEWTRELRDRQSEGVAFFFTQWGGIRSKAGGRVLDGRTWDEMPATALGRASHTGPENGAKNILARAS
jgi:protein gp37